MERRRRRRRQRANPGRTELHKSGAPADLDKRGIFGYPAGKTRLASMLVKLIPEHDTYVEAFCGSAAVFFEKQHDADVEVLNDARRDLMLLYRDLSKLTDRDLDKLDKCDWVGKASTFKRLFKSTPKDRIGRAYRGLYLQRFSRMKDSRTGAFDTSYEGSRSLAVKRLRARLKRLKRAKLYCGDYETVVREFDSPRTFFFLDPPYVGYDVNVGERSFDEDKFVKVLRSIKGKFLVTYGVRGKAKFDGFHVRQVRDDKARNLSTKEGGVDTLLITNYPMTQKSESVGPEIVKLDDDELRNDSTDASALLRVLSRKSGPLPAVYQYRVSGGELHGELRVSDGDHLVGWTLDVRRPGAVDKGIDTIEFAQSIAGAFSVHGDRHARSLRDPDGVPAVLKSAHSLNWLNVDGEVELPGRGKAFVVPVDRLQSEPGLQGDTDRELFLSKGQRLNGILRVRQAKADGEWRVLLSSSLLPSVLDVDAVDSGRMPDVGCSALPSSLERDVPPEFRYWASDDVNVARKMRDALVKSGWFTSDNVRIVDGDFRRVVTKLYLPSEREFDHDPDPVDWIDRVAKAIDVDDVVEVFGDERPGDGAVAYCDLGVFADGEVERVVAALGKGEFVLGAVDTPSARAELGKVGPVFKFRPDRSTGVDALDRVFASTRPLSRIVDVEFVGNEPIAKQRKPEGKTFIEHARAWVKSRGLLDADSDYDGMLGKAVLRLAESHDEEGHSGTSAQLARAYFNWLCDAWDGLNTLLLTDESAAKARAALGKCAVGQIDHLLGGDATDELDARIDKVLAKEIQVFKANGSKDERYVLGIVLEPETVDSQGDIYSAEEVRNTAHKFMSEYQQIGFMHRASLSGKVKILESYLAPAAFKIGGQSVKPGTWLLAVRVLDAALWKAIKSGAFTGFSIGGSAVRKPERRS